MSGSACLLFCCGLEKTVWGNVSDPCIFYREFLGFLERTVFLLRKGATHCKLNECLQIKKRELIFMPTTLNQSALHKTSRSHIHIHSAVLWKSFIRGWFWACLYLKTFNPFTAPGGSLSNVSFFCWLNIKNIICLSLSLLFLVLSGVSVERSFSFLQQSFTYLKAVIMSLFSLFLQTKQTQFFQSFLICHVF